MFAHTQVSEAFIMEATKNNIFKAKKLYIQILHTIKNKITFKSYATVTFLIIVFVGKNNCFIILLEAQKHLSCLKINYF